MAEMQSAWEEYVKKDKKKFKTMFSFNDLATFDRSLYAQISNPLVLRLFLETYQGKPLPKKGVKHLNIYRDWLANFKESEINFLKLLAQAVWDKGENELLLDDLLKNETIAPYLDTDLINDPYPRLKNLGWISRYIKELDVYVSFTVEGSLLYLMGRMLSTQQETSVLETMKSLIKKGTLLQESAIEYFLSDKALKGDLELVSELIDSGEEYHTLCGKAMLLYLKAFGVQAFIDVMFDPTTENDWRALLQLEKILNDLEENVLRKELLQGLRIL